MSGAKVNHSGFPPIHFCYGQGESKTLKILDIVIQTARLTARMAQNTATDLALLKSLLQDPRVMTQYGDRTPYQDDRLQTMLKKYEDRAKANSPFVGFLIFMNSGDLASKKFVGFFVVGLDDTEGWAHLAYAALPDFWHQGIASEVAGSLRDYFFFVYNLYHAKIPGLKPHEWVTWQGVVATSWFDNIYSNALLRKAFKTEPSTIEVPSSDGQPPGKKNRYALFFREILAALKPADAEPEAAAAAS